MVEFNIDKATDIEQAITIIKDYHRVYRQVVKRIRADCRGLKMFGHEQDEFGRGVDFGEYYQELPLLVEVPKEQLHHEPGPQSEPASLPDLDGWQEQYLQGRSRDDQEVAIEELLRDFAGMTSNKFGSLPRFIVTGAPGSGKTTLGQYLARILTARGQELRIQERTWLPVRFSLREWEAMATPNYCDLAQYLHSLGRDYPDVSVAQWRQWLQRGVFLIADGLDELRSRTDRFYEQLIRELGDYGNCPLVLTCRRVSFEQYKELEQTWPVFRLGKLTHAGQEHYIKNYPHKYCHYNGDGLWLQLRSNPAMQLLASNPLLLSIICFVVDDRDKEILLPETRVFFYRKAVAKLLQRKRSEAEQNICNWPQADIRQFLENLALSLFLADERGLIREELLSTYAARSGQPLDYSKSETNACIADLNHNSGLLRQANNLSDDEPSYLFLHLTFQEYLAATALARLINEHGWGAVIPGADSAWALVYRRSWDPNWRQVIALLGGGLDDPTPLLKMLSVAREADIFRHRLALAVECLAELSLEQRKKHLRLVERIADDAFAVWWQHQLRNTTTVVPHLTYILPILAQLTEKATSALLAYLQDADDDVRRSAADALGKMGAAAATEPVLLALLAYLQDADDDVRWSAADALGQMGAAAATEPVLLALLASLQDADAYVRWSAADALGKMGAAAATEPVLLALPAYLQDANAYVRRSAADALGKMGAAAATEPVILALLASLQDADAYVRWSAAEALGKMGATAATEPVILALLASLQDADAYVRWSAAEALGKMGATAATEPVILALLASLQDADAYVRRSAAETLGKMGAAAATEPVILALLASLQDADDDVRRSAADALGKMGAAAATEPVILALLASLQDADDDVRRSAAEALGKMGAAAATEPVILALLASLQDADDDVRRSAADALGKIGASAATEPVLLALLASLQDADAFVRRNAAEALGKMGAAAATEPVILALLASLQDADAFMRRSAADALGKMGAVAATEPILLALLASLQDADDDVRSSAAEALGKMGAAAATEPVLLALLASLQDADAFVRRSAAEALGKMGAAAATEPVLLALLAFLQGADAFVRPHAASALAKIIPKHHYLFARSGKFILRDMNK